MSKNRLLFSKTGRAKYISHLDLMHTMQRAFFRADVRIRHTEGFNPHPYISLALPLSLGQESLCELMDFDLADGEIADLPGKLNPALPEGIEVLSAYDAERKAKEIKWIQVTGILSYDGDADDGIISKLESLFHADTLVIEKRTKRGTAQTDILPMIHSISFSRDDDRVRMDAVVSAQNPSLNPDHIVTAIHTHMPEYAPDFASFKRLEVYDGDMRIFR